jgi:selenocysteine-specific elongation factor
MAIDRAFTVAGHGTVVTGTVASGHVTVGDDLELLPERRPVRVRAIQRHDRPVERVGRGTRAAINLAGVHHTAIRRGQELGVPGYLKPARIMSIELRVSADAPRPLRHRRRYRVHLGTAEVLARVALLTSNELGAGESCLAQLHFDEPVVAVHGQPLVIREESPQATLGGGRVLQPRARRIRRRDVATRDRLARLQSPDPAERVAAALAFRGLSPSTEPALSRMTGLSPAAVAQAVERLTTQGSIVELPLGPRRSVRVVAEFAAELEDRVLRALGRLHDDRPRQSSIPRSHVIAALPDLNDDAMIGGLLARLEQANRVSSSGRAVSVRGREPSLSQAERRLKSELAEGVRQGRFSPPDAAEMAAVAGSRASVVPELLTLLAEEERIVCIGPGLYLDFDVVAELRRRVSERLSDGSSLTMAELRDLLGTTRKFAVPIGEYLDRIGVTCREGDLRRLGETPTPGA